MNKDISLQIKTLRKKNGLTQIEFARRAGVGLRFLRELEQGKITIRMDKFLQVLAFLGYHIELKKDIEVRPPNLLCCNRFGGLTS